MFSIFILLRGDPGLMIFIGFIVLAVAGVTYYFSRKATVRRELGSLGVKKIKDFADGDRGKIVGKVVFAGEKIEAPLSKRTCVYYHVIVEQYHRGGRSGRWVKMFEEEKTGDVVMNDGTGYAIVDTRNALSYLFPDVEYTSGTFNDATVELEEFLSRHNYTSTNLFGLNKSLRYKEGVLEQDELFAVMGEGQWNETKDHNLRLPAKQVLVITAQAEEKVFLSDDPDTIEEN